MSFPCGGAPAPARDSEHSRRKVLLPGFLAFLLLLVEVHLVKVTSSLTLAVFGNLKSIVTILFSIFVFGEKTTALQWSGLLLALAGMLVYARLKNQSVAVDSLASLQYEVLPQDEDTWPDPAATCAAEEPQKASAGQSPTVLGASDQSAPGLEDFATFDEALDADAKPVGADQPTGAATPRQAE
ncbi:SLC35E4 [Symbiodinium sp. CCMP2456]|nr:SLC35E4 [Symbiodinium sp. CCMP2456]